MIDDLSVFDVRVVASCNHVAEPKGGGRWLVEGQNASRRDAAVLRVRARPGAAGARQGFGIANRQTVKDSRRSSECVTGWTIAVRLPRFSLMLAGSGERPPSGPQMSE